MKEENVVYALAALGILFAYAMMFVGFVIIASSLMEG